MTSMTKLIKRSGTKESEAPSQASFRPSEMIKRPSAICEVMSDHHKPRTSGRESLYSTSSVESEIDGAALIDNEMAKTFGSSTSQLATPTDASEKKSSGIFSFTSKVPDDHILQQASKKNQPNVVGNINILQDPLDSLQDTISASFCSSDTSVGAEMMRAIFGDHSYEVLRPKHHSLPEVLKQIFGSQHNETTPSAGHMMLKKGNSHLVLPTNSQSRLRQWISACRRRCGVLMLDSKSQAFFIVLTLYALFAPDLVNWLARSSMDDTFLIINTVVFAFFVLEVMFLAAGVRGWLCSVPAALDVMAVLSFLSETLVMQGSMFGGNDGERTTRMARSTRMTRFVRIARVARVTKLVPALIEFLGGHSDSLAKHVLKRRLWRLFLFLDTEKRGRLTALDFKVVYLLTMQECPYLLGSQTEVNLLTRDLHHFTHDPRLQNLDTTFNFTEFTHTLTSLAFGKQLLTFHLQEVEKDDGVWSLTRRVSDSSALKICLGILIIYITLTILDTSYFNESHVQGLGMIDFIVGREYRRTLTLNRSLVCEHIKDYMDDHKVMLMLLADHVFISRPGAECGPGISRSELDPFSRVDEIMDNSTLRSTEVLLICWPEDSKCDNSSRSAVLLDTEEDTRNTAMFSVLTTSTILVLILIFILLFNRVVSRFSKSLLKPLRALVDDMHALCTLELVDIDADALDEADKKRNIKVADEMVHLQKAFGTMRTAVRSWGKYVPPAVVQRLMTSGFEATIGVVRVQASILFVDIDDFENVCCGLSPEATLGVLSAVLGKVAEAIEDNKGILLEFIGDEVLAVFNVPQMIPHHTYHATKCAIEIHMGVEKISTMVQDGRNIAVRCKTGVHTAQILAGNVGSKRRMKFGLLGDGVNLTARLKMLNTRYKTQTMVSDTVIAADLIDELFVWRPLEKVAVKGRKEATCVYEVLGLRDADGMQEFARLAQLHREAFDLYHRREFVEAAKLVGEVRSLFEVVGRPDEPSRQLLQKCNRYIAEPPPPEWDGVERLQKKSFEVPKEDEKTDAKRDEKKQDTEIDSKRDSFMLEGMQVINRGAHVLETYKAEAEAFANEEVHIEDARLDSSLFDMALSMPSSTLPAPMDIHHIAAPVNKSSVVTRSRPNVGGSCWRHLLQVPQPSKNGRGWGCDCMAPAPQGPDPTSSAFPCCNNMSMPAIVVLPGPEIRLDPNSRQASGPQCAPKDSSR